MNRGCYGIAPRGKGLSGGLFGFPRGAFGDAAARTPPVSGMAAWWDGADQASMTIVSDAISQWNDKSGNGNHLSQATSSSRPLIASPSNTAKLNNVLIPRFDGLDHMDAASLSLVVPFTILAVTCPEGISDNVIVARSAGNDYRFCYRSSGLRWTAFNDGGEGALTGFTPEVNGSFGTAFAYTGAHVARSTTDHTLYARNLKTDHTAALPSGSAAIRVGTTQAAGQFYVGAMAEILVWASALSEQDILKIFNYFRAKWGVQ